MGIGVRLVGRQSRRIVEAESQRNQVGPTLFSLAGTMDVHISKWHAMESFKGLYASSLGSRCCRTLVVIGLHDHKSSSQRRMPKRF